MRVGFFILAAVALFCSVNTFVIKSNSPLSVILNKTQLPSEPTGPKGNCYVEYAQTAYQIGVVGGAELRFCAENAAKDVEHSSVVSQCAENELAKITAQLNFASDQLAVCLTEGAF